MKKLCLLLMAVLLTLCSACSNSSLENAGKELKDSVSSTIDANNKYVLMVKNGYRENNPALTYDKAFSAFFGTPRWKYFKGDKGQDVVEFTGDCTYQDVAVKARIQFVVDEKQGTFEAEYLAFNEVPQNTFILSALITKVFEDNKNDSSKKSSVSPSLEQTAAKSENSATTTQQTIATQIDQDKHNAATNIVQPEALNALYGIWGPPNTGFEDLKFNEKEFNGNGYSVLEARVINAFEGLYAIRLKVYDPNQAYFLSMYIFRDGRYNNKPLIIVTKDSTDIITEEKPYVKFK